MVIPEGAYTFDNNRTSVPSRHTSNGYRHRAPPQYPNPPYHAQLT